MAADSVGESREVREEIEVDEDGRVDLEALLVAVVDTGSGIDACCNRCFVLTDVVGRDGVIVEVVTCAWVRFFPLFAVVG